VQRVEALERRNLHGRKRFIIESRFLGPNAWCNADGWKLFFVHSADHDPWTLDAKAAVLARHLGVSPAEARRLAQLDQLPCFMTR
jgi:hypothetical protein